MAEINAFRLLDERDIGSTGGGGGTTPAGDYLETTGGTISGDLEVTGKTTLNNLIAEQISGQGTNITSLNASNLTTGTLRINLLPLSEVNVGTYGPSTDLSPKPDKTFTVPSFQVDGYGRIIEAVNRTITLPSDTNTDEKVQITLDDAKKFYFTGTSFSSSNIGPLYFDSNIYTTTTPGELVAETFTGTLNGTANNALESNYALRAVADEKGKNINETCASLQSQIDNLIINAGESGDVTAEVVQARTSIDGTGHDLLGTRLNTIETNSDNTEKRLNAVFGSSIPFGKFKNGSWYATNKTITSASWSHYRVVHTTNQYAECNLKFTPKSGYGIAIIYFDNETATTYTNSPSITYNTTLVVNAGRYYRLCIQKSGVDNVDNGAADINEYVNAVIMEGKINEMEEDLNTNIKMLKSDIYNSDGNLFDPELIGHGRSYQYASSNYVTNSDYHYYHIELDEGETYTVSQTSTTNLYIRFKYADGTYSITQNTYPEKSVTFVVPSSCELVTLTCQTAALDKWMLTKGDVVRPYEPYVKYRYVENNIEFQAEMDSLTKVKKDLYKRSSNLIDSTLIVPHYTATNLDGTYTNMGSSSDYNYLELSSLEVGETYTYSTQVQGNLTVRFRCNGNEYSKLTTTGGGKSITFTVPEGCDLIAFTFQTKQLKTLMLGKGETPLFYETSNPYRFVEKAELDTVCDITDIISITAHRGYSSVYPENTLLAYEKGYEYGFRRFEADVKRTSDGVLVCMHDDTINRTARNLDGTELTETINIADITFDEANQYNYGIFKHESFTDCPIFKLSDFLIFCKSHGCAASLDAITEDTAEQVANLVVKYGMQKYAYFSSFSNGALIKVKNVIPNANLSVSRSTTITTTDVDTFINDVKPGGEFSIGMYIDVASEEICEYVHQKGYKFGVYTINNKTQYEKAVNMGADNIATDGYNPKR